MSNFESEKEIETEIGRLRALLSEKKGNRPVSEGWSINTVNSNPHMAFLSRITPQGPCHVGVISSEGFSPTSSAAFGLQGIKADDIGRINVFGYEPEEVVSEMVSQAHEKGVQQGFAILASHASMTFSDGLNAALYGYDRKGAAFDAVMELFNEAITLDGEEK